MKVLITSLLLTILVSSVCSATNGTLTPKHQSALTQWLKTLEIRKNAFEKKAETVKQAKTNLPTGKACIFASDCPSGYMCLNMVEIAFNFLSLVGVPEQFETIIKKSNIEGKECWRDPTEAFNTISADKILKQMIASKARLRTIYVYLQDNYVNLPIPSGLLEDSDNDILSKSKMPSLRQGLQGNAATGANLNSLMLILALRGDKKMDDILPFILMSAGGNVGPGGSFMNNPFLFYILLQNDTNLADDKTLLLLMATMFSGNQMAGGNGANLMASPLLLMTLLNDTADSSLNDLLPLLLFSGGMGAGGSNVAASNPLLLNLLLNYKGDSVLIKTAEDLAKAAETLAATIAAKEADYEDSPTADLKTEIDGLKEEYAGAAELAANALKEAENSKKELLPLLLISSMGAQGGDISSALPLILLQDDLKSGDDNNILLILALSGGFGRVNTGLNANLRQGQVNNMFGGLSGGNMASLLPLILLGNDKLDSNDLLLFSLLSQDPNGMGGQGLQGILPLLLLTNSSSNSSSMLLKVLLLTGGQGGLGQGGLGQGGSLEGILPLLLLKDSTDNKDLLLIMLLGGLGGNTGGLGGDMNSLLPLLLLMGDSKLDSNLLLMIMLISQQQPGTVTVDPNTGLQVGVDSGMNFLLPFLVMDSSSSSDSSLTDSLVLMMIMSQQQTGIQALG